MSSVTCPESSLALENAPLMLKVSGTILDVARDAVFAGSSQPGSAMVHFMTVTPFGLYSGARKGIRTVFLSVT